ncbi:hypothetical protein [Bacillus siamensis]
MLDAIGAAGIGLMNTRTGRGAASISIAVCRPHSKRGRMAKS